MRIPDQATAACGQFPGNKRRLFTLNNLINKGERQKKKVILYKDAGFHILELYLNIKFEVQNGKT